MSRTHLFGSLSGYAFLVNLSRVVFAPLLAVFMTQFGVGEATAGLVVTAAWVGSALPRVPTGYLLTRFSRVSVVMGAGAVLVVGAILTALARDIPALVVGAGCMGLASGVYFVAGNTLISELFPRRPGRMLGLHGMASQLAAVLAAPLVTLTLGATVTLALTGWTVRGWRLVFVGIAVGAVAVTSLAVVTARRADLPELGATDRDLFGAIRTEWRFILAGLAVMGVTGFVWQGIFNFYELFMETRGLGPTAAKNSLTIVFGAGVPAFMLSGRLADRLPHLPYILGLMGTFVLAVLALTTVTGLVPLLVLSAVVGLVVHSLFPAMDTYLLEGLPDTNRASAYSAYSGSMMLAQAPGSWVVGSLVESGVAYVTVFRTFALLLGAVVVGLAVARRVGVLPGSE